MNIQPVFYTLCIFLIACEDTPSPIYTIEGYIYEDCGMTPYANQNLELYQDITYTGYSTPGGILAETITDSEGYFKFTYTPENNEPVLIQNGGSNIIGVPLDTNIHDLIAYVTPTCNILVNLNVITTYNEEDTLYITDFNNIVEKLAVPGPFSSGFLYSSEDFSLLGSNYIGFPLDVGYKVNDGEWIIKNVVLHVCETNNITIDIY